jgi:hypothetical protein
MTDKSNQLRDTEIALMDAIKTVMEIIMTAGIAGPSVFDKMFSYQRDAYIQKQMGEAAGVMELLRKFASDPTRAEHREGLRKLLTEEPKGSA